MSTMIKQRLQTIIHRLRRAFKKKSGPCVGVCTDEASTDVAQSEQADKSVDVTATRSSSAKSSDEPKSSTQHDGPPGYKEHVSSGSFSDSGRASEDLVSRLSESPTVPRPMPQLPTIVIGEDLEPISIDLGTRRDSDHLVHFFFLYPVYLLTSMQPRDEPSSEHNHSI